MIKQLIITSIIVLVLLKSNAQQQQGKIIFERTLQMQIRIATNDGFAEQDNLLPKTKKDKFELSFTSDQTMWKQLEQEDQEDEMAVNNGGGGVQIRMIGPGGDDIMYSNLPLARKVEQRELGTKKYIVEDSIRSFNWKISDETKTLLGHVCRKATSQKIGKRMMMNMDDGKVERKEVADTSNITAWFTSDIPVSSGPAEYQGQLPGMILEIDINNGRSSYKALEILNKVDLAIIKEPKGPKKITPTEFDKERNKLFEEMGKNNGGSGRTIRINN
ncbi:MAG: GLPGLI family protein [Chitinophagaceae bacterium]